MSDEYAPAPSVLSLAALPLIRRNKSRGFGQADSSRLIRVVLLPNAHPGKLQAAPAPSRLEILCELAPRSTAVAIVTYPAASRLGTLYELLPRSHC